MTVQRREKMADEDMEEIIAKYSKLLGMGRDQIMNAWADFVLMNKSTKNPVRSTTAPPPPPHRSCSSSGSGSAPGRWNSRGGANVAFMVRH